MNYTCNVKMMKKLAMANAVAFLLAAGTAVQAQGTTTPTGGSSGASAGGSQGSTSGMSTDAGGQRGAGGSSATSMTAEPMKADEIREILKTQGYSDLKELEYEGKSIRADAKRYGKEVEVKVHLITGMVKEQGRLSESQVKEKLEQLSAQSGHIIEEKDRS